MLGSKNADIEEIYSQSCSSTRNVRNTHLFEGLEKCYWPNSSSFFFHLETGQKNILKKNNGKPVQKQSKRILHIIKPCKIKASLKYVAALHHILN